MKTEIAGICGTDVHLWHGRLKVPTPFILGHEAVGRIEQLGSEVSTDTVGQPVSVGDRIMWSPGVACNRCYFCLIGEITKCRARKVYGVVFPCHTQPHLFGDFSEYVYLIPGASFFKVPDAPSNEALIAFGCAGPTMIHGFERVGGARPGDSVVVQGAGPVGLFALILAKGSGARKVVVVGGPRARLQMAKEFGADHTLDIDETPDSMDRVRKVQELTDQIGADIVIDAAGVPAAVGEGWRMTRDAGRYLEVGQYTDRGTVPLNPHDVTRKHITIFGSWGQMPRHLHRYIHLVSQFSSKYPFEKMVTHKFALEQAMDGIRTVEAWQAVKATIVP